MQITLICHHIETLRCLRLCLSFQFRLHSSQYYRKLYEGETFNKVSFGGFIFHAWIDHRFRFFNGINSDVSPLWCRHALTATRVWRANCDQA